MDDLYQIVWLTQKESDSNHIYDHKNNQLPHCNLVTGILEAMLYQKRLLPLFIMTFLVSENCLIYFWIVFHEEMDKCGYYPTFDRNFLYHYDAITCTGDIQKERNALGVMMTLILRTTFNLIFWVLTLITLTNQGMTSSYFFLRNFKSNESHWDYKKIQSNKSNLYLSFQFNGSNWHLAQFQYNESNFYGVITGI